LRVKRPTIQILTRDVNIVEAKSIADAIYNLLHGKFGLTLPSVVVGSVTYDQIRSERIYGIQTPASIGLDDNGREEFSCNYEILFNNE